MKVKTRDLFYFILYTLLLFPFFRITYFTFRYSSIESIYKILQIIAAIIIIFLILGCKKYSKIINYIFLYLIVLVMSTFLNHGELVTSLFLALRTLILCLIVDYGLKHHTKVFLNSFEFLLTFLVYLNFISIVLFRGGLYATEFGYTENWLLGYKNLHILYILPAILVSFVNSYYSKGKFSFRSYLLLFISTLSLLVVNSSTSLIGIFLIVAYLIFQGIVDWVNFFNIKNYTILYFVLFLSIVVLRVQNLFRFIIVDIFHKDLTLTGRTYIWDYVTNFIQRKKALGYGMENSSVRLNKTSYWRSSHAHDQLLEIIYKTGFVGLVVYLIIMYKTFKELYQYRKYKMAKFISIVVLAYCIMMLTEFYLFDTYMFIFVFCYNIKFLLREEDKNETKDFRSCSSL